MKDLTVSHIQRQNILNNRYALEEIQKAADIKGIFFDNEYWITKKQAAEFFEVDERTISRYLENNEDELINNGYTVLRGNQLKEYMLAVEKQAGKDMNVPTKTTILGIFNFRAFLNLAMLSRWKQKDFHCPGNSIFKLKWISLLH